MKVKNIVFFGFAAAILSGTANADPLQVASTAYVTSQLSAKADASTTYTKSEVDGLLDDKQDTISDLSTIRSGAAAGATALQQADLAGYATTAAMNTALEDYTTTADLNTALAAKANANIIGSGFDTTNTVAAALADKADDSDLTTLEGRVDAVEDTIGTGTMSVNGANQATIVAAINALDSKTNGLATDQNLTDLQNNVTALSTTMGNTSLATTAQTVTGAVNELRSALLAILPAANTCTSSNNHCVLSVDKTTGDLTWIDVTSPFEIE